MGWKFSLVGENRRCIQSVRRCMSWETVAWKTGEQMNEYLKEGSYGNRCNAGK